MDGNMSNDLPDGWTPEMLERLKEDVIHDGPETMYWGPDTAYWESYSDQDRRDEFFKGVVVGVSFGSIIWIIILFIMWLFLA